MRKIVLTLGGAERAVSKGEARESLPPVMTK
jgi:hypothetical protein